MANQLTQAILEKFGYDRERLTKLLDLNLAEEQYLAYQKRLANAFHHAELAKLEPIFSHIQKGSVANE